MQYNTAAAKGTIQTINDMATTQVPSASCIIIVFARLESKRDRFLFIELQ